MSVLQSRKPLIGIAWYSNNSDVKLAADFHELWNIADVRSMFTTRTMDGDASEDVLVMYDHQRLTTPERQRFVDILANIRIRLLCRSLHSELIAHPLITSLQLGAYGVSIASETLEPEYSLNLGQHSYQPRQPVGLTPPAADREIWMYVLLRTVDGTLLI